MLFNSYQFAIFLPIVFIVYWIIPDKIRWLFLLLASYYFYMSWNIKYVFLILFTTIISYLCALLIFNSKNHEMKKVWLSVALVSSLGLLFVFKYFDFFCEIINEMVKPFTIPISSFTANLVLPVGISFYTFQTISYVIDVYRDNEVPEYHFGKYATFISFFPQLVAGPIERTSDLLPQIKAKHYFDYNKATYGMKQISWGVFKKVVIADTLALFVDSMYGDFLHYNGMVLFIVAVLFSIQIYCDFSGYSDIAIGTAKLFGIDLMTNFSSPYFSKSIKDFWSRWHISLSTWFRDYVYIPLGGNRCSKTKNALNLFITFVLSGLWHGANKTFIVWGAIHGLGQIIEKNLLPLQKNNKFDMKLPSRIMKGIRIIVVFVFVSFAWIFFRADSLWDARYIITSMFVGIIHPVTYVRDGLHMAVEIGLNSFELSKMALYISLLFFFDFFSMRMDVIQTISNQKKVVRWGIYISFILFVLTMIPSGGNKNFIYFQF